jgi:hypothetical protein
MLGEESAREGARCVRDRVVDHVVRTETPVDDFVLGVLQASFWRAWRTKYAALFQLTGQPSRGARAALEVAGAICA